MNRIIVLCLAIVWTAACAGIRARNQEWREAFAWHQAIIVVQEHTKGISCYEGKLGAVARPPAFVRDDLNPDRAGEYHKGAGVIYYRTDRVLVHEYVHHINTVVAPSTACYDEFVARLLQANIDLGARLQQEQQRKRRYSTQF